MKEIDIYFLNIMEWKKQLGTFGISAFLGRRGGGSINVHDFALEIRKIAIRILIHPDKVIGHSKPNFKMILSQGNC